MPTAVSPSFPALQLSAMLTSLPGEFTTAVRRLATLGFSHVDVVAMADRPAEHLEALADSRLLVSCALIGRELPKGQTLDAEPLAIRRAAVESAREHITDAARLGATTCYLAPGQNTATDGLARFADTCTVMADFAAGRMIRLCVEHIPGSALSRADDTVAWIRAVGHPNLRLLLDIGHCLITGEDPLASVVLAGPLLGYVHWDDNDSKDDLHWPLLRGRLTESIIQNVLSACRNANCTSFALELKNDLDQPEDDLRQGKALIERLYHAASSSDGLGRTNDNATRRAALNP
jgi:sugar phosphate isomerase/epimerase